MIKKLLIGCLVVSTVSNAGFFQEEDKQKHIAYSVPFGAIGGLICKEKIGLNGWKAVGCGTLIGMIPGILKEAYDQHSYGGWDNRDIMADAIGAGIGAVGTITIYRFSSGSW